MKAFFLVASAAIFFALPAMAQDTSVSLPIGEIVAYILPTAAMLLFGGILWIAKSVSPSLYAILRTAQTEQLLGRAIDYGINVVYGASKGRELSVDVGNEVLKEALRFTILHGGGWVAEFAGGPHELAQKIYARLNLPETSYRPDFAILINEALDPNPPMTAKAAA